MKNVFHQMVYIHVIVSVCWATHLNQQIFEYYVMKSHQPIKDRLCNSTGYHGKQTLLYNARDFNSHFRWLNDWMCHQVIISSAADLHVILQLKGTQKCMVQEYFEIQLMGYLQSNLLFIFAICFKYREIKSRVE